MTSHTVTLAEFLGDTAKVLPMLDQSFIQVARPDGENLVVMTESQRAALATAINMMYCQELADHSGLDELPYWFKFLPASDQVACAREVRDTALGAIQTGRLSDLTQLLLEWEATGLGHWSLAQQGSDPEYAVASAVDLPRPNG